MARPKPDVVLFVPSPGRKGWLREVVTCPGIFVVTLDGQPFNLRDRCEAEYGYLYRGTSKANPGWAFNLAEKLNRQFRTDRFGVALVTAMRPAVEGDDWTDLAPRP